MTAHAVSVSVEGLSSQTLTFTEKLPTPDFDGNGQVNFDEFLSCAGWFGSRRGLRPGGFGLLMVKTSADELLYNESRNEVVFVKYLDSPKDRSE